MLSVINYLAGPVLKALKNILVVNLIGIYSLTIPLLSISHIHLLALGNGQIEVSETRADNFSGGKSLVKDTFCPVCLRLQSTFPFSVSTVFIAVLSEYFLLSIPHDIATFTVHSLSQRQRSPPDIFPS